MPPKAQTLLTAALCVSGWFIGYLISAASSILFFRLGGIDPEHPATSTLIVLYTTLYGVVFAIVASWIGACFSRRNGLGIGISIADRKSVV